MKFIYAIWDNSQIIGIQMTIVIFRSVKICYLEII